MEGYFQILLETVRNLSKLHCGAIWPKYEHSTCQNLPNVDVYQVFDFKLALLLCTVPCRGLSALDCFIYLKTFTRTSQLVKSYPQNPTSTSDFTLFGRCGSSLNKIAVQSGCDHIYKSLNKHLLVWYKKCVQQKEPAALIQTGRPNYKSQLALGLKSSFSMCCVKSTVKS